MIANQSTIGLTCLVVGGVRLIDHGGLADPAGKRLCRVRLVVNDLRMVELHAGLYDYRNHASSPRQTERGKGLTMRFQRLRGIFHTGNMNAVNTAGFTAGNGNLSTNHVG